MGELVIRHLLKIGLAFPERRPAETRSINLASISTNSLKPYSTITDVPHGLNIVINWDSSVASAPAPFITVVEQVADFYASALQPISSGPITIDVGYLEALLKMISTVRSVAGLPHDYRVLTSCPR